MHRAPVGPSLREGGRGPGMQDRQSLLCSGSPRRLTLRAWGCALLPAPATRAVINTASPQPYPAGAGTPRPWVPAASRHNPPHHPAARFSKDNSVLCPETCRACHACCSAAPRPPKASRHQPRQSLLHPARQVPPTPHSATFGRSRARGIRTSDFGLRISFAPRPSGPRISVLLLFRCFSPSACFSPVPRPHPPASSIRGPEGGAL